MVAARTPTPPPELLAIAKDLERGAGRESGPPNAPRPLDVDIILYGDEVIEREELTLPHPRLRQRRFVLAPIVALEPEIRLPPNGAAAREVLADLDPDPDFERLRWN